MKKKVVAVLTGDVHLMDKKPACRLEKNYYEWQKEKLLWIRSICDKHQVPLIIAGDIFDRAKQSNELVNLAIDNLPVTYCISGNHDQNCANVELNGKTAYGSFIRAKNINEMNKPTKFGDITIHPFHFNQELKPCSSKSGFNIAMIHELTWMVEPFKDAPKKGNVDELVKVMSGFDLIISSDNHQFFTADVEGTKILNQGSPFRISASQINYAPHIHILYEDGSFSSIPVPCEDDLITRDHLDDKQRVEDKVKRVAERLKGNKSEEKNVLSFEERVLRATIVAEANVNVVEIIKKEMV